MSNDRQIIGFALADSEFSTFFSLLVSVEMRNDQKELTVAFHHFGVQITGERLRALAIEILNRKTGYVQPGKANGEMDAEQQYTVTGIKIIKE